MHSETGFAAPARRRREELRQPSMLKVGKPGHSGIGQTPAKEPGSFEDGVDAMRPEFCYCLPVQSPCQRRSQTDMAVERRRSHHLHTRYRGKRRKIGIIITGPGKQDGRKLAGAELAQRLK
ncbi:hypothetical protein [Bradyrhizobium sp. RDI18]|uniref:hypothetical protein n=1 Tax=Bradyrhizobium sp. RDI18 TaxID=3367400 RepID=UPI003714D5AC